MTDADIAGSTILIIDDDVVFRGLMRRVLENAGYATIHEVDDGSEGLKAVETHRPDVVILDIMMSQMNGLQFLKSLRSALTNADPKTPVIVITGIPSPTIIAASTKLACDAFVRKDGGLKTLADKVSRVLAAPVEKAEPISYITVSLPEVDKPSEASPALREFEEQNDTRERLVSIDHLEPGSVLARDIESSDGTVLFHEGEQLTESEIGRLHDVSELFGLQAVMVCDS